MVHRTRTIGGHWCWYTVSGAGPLFVRHKTVGVQSGCCVRCGEGEAEESRWAARGVGGLRVPRWVWVGRLRARENHSGIREWVLSTELIKTSPFNRAVPLSLPRPLFPSLPHTPFLATCHTRGHACMYENEGRTCWCSGSR